jgi:benzoyl-CoA reductase/2-hydroxyglutaryl-CoA dehydratase subunit BcrC/BadD/HgdB
LQYCHAFNVEGVKIANLFKKQDMPLINVESDYTREDLAQIRTRLEAFLEMIMAKAESS